MSHIVKNHQERTNTNLRPTTKEKAKKDIKCSEDLAEIYLKNKSRSCTFFCAGCHPQSQQYQCCYPGWAFRHHNLGYYVPLGGRKGLCSLAYCTTVQALKTGPSSFSLLLPSQISLLRRQYTKVHCWYTHRVLCSQFVRDDILTRSCIPPSSSELKKMHNAGRATAKRTLWHQLLVLTESTVVHTTFCFYFISLCIGGSNMSYFY